MPEIDLESYTGVILCKRGSVLYAELNNPEKKNALNPSMQSDLNRLWREVDEDDEVHVIVLSGKGDAFCAGVDLKAIASSTDPESQPPSRPFSVKWSRRAFWGMLDCEKPIISKVRGPAYGLGVSICLSADIVIASDNARFSDSHVKNGIAPGDGGPALWPLLIGFNRAKEHLMLGDAITAAEAAEMGLINHMLPDAELDQFVDDMADRLAGGAPLAIRFAKLSVNVMLKQLFAGAFETSLAYDMLTLRTEDVHEGAQAFVERRPPRFTGR